ncbi:porimin [Osmerus eperlanus]|uniref:porimin n=1 Tax=Osmerus eperlanus TaxID=29151 RepID=UPI002E0F49AC
MFRLNVLHIMVAFTSVWWASDSASSARFDTGLTKAGDSVPVTTPLENPTTNPSYTIQTEAFLKTQIKPPTATLSGIALVTTIHPPAPSRFDAGSFLGGMMLALILTLAIALGYKLACTKQDVRYRTLREEHEAII